MAGVARSTVYLIVGSRAGLFDALTADLLECGRFDRIVEAVAHPDVGERLRRALRGSVQMFATASTPSTLLYTGRGLSVDEIASLLVTTAERSLYRPEATLADQA